MKLFRVRKDGGPESHVTGYWLIESKRLFSICLLKFEHGSRDAYHSHAFNSINWLLTGELHEQFIHSNGRSHFPSFKPIVTRCTDFHKVTSRGTSWVLSFRGPWTSTWEEFVPKVGFSTLTNGRARVA